MKTDKPRNTWQIRDVDEETKRRVRVFAARNNIRKTSLALAKMVEIALNTSQKQP